VISRTLGREGRVLIPAFSVGRTQTVVYHLHHLFLSGLSPCAVFVDSPLSANVTDVFRRHPECYDEDTGEFLTKKLDPFGFERLVYLRTVEESKALNDRRGPFITIAASGMCESGRILHHLKQVAPHPENTILLVGFMAENTLGRRIQGGEELVKILGQEYPRRAEVETIGGYSAHADRNELRAWIRRLGGPIRRAFVVHGEPNALGAMATILREEGVRDVVLPKHGEGFDL